MSTIKDEFADIKSEAKDKLAADVAELKASFNKLRGDLMTLVQDAMGVSKDVGRAGVDAAKTEASVAYDTAKGKVEDLREKGNEQLEALSRKIEENPVASALIAVGVGFLVAKLLTRK